MPIAIETRELVKHYGRQAVLRGVSLQLRAGEIVALTGENGSGKTTLLGCLAGLYRPTAGEVRWPLSPCGPRGAVGLVGHEPGLYPQLSLRENLVFAARMWGSHLPAAAADHWLAEIGMSRWAARTPGKVSLGMRKRVSIARALLHEPAAVLMDEPFSALDQPGREWLSNVLRGLRQRQRAVCFVTHDASEAAQLADRVLCLRGGQIEETRARQFAA